MAASSISPKKAGQIAKKAAETVLTQTRQVLVQANTPEMLPGLTGQRVVELWPMWRADLEKRARNTDIRHHKALIEQALKPLAVAMLDIEFSSKHMIDKWNETDFGDTTSATYESNKEYPRKYGNEPQNWINLPFKELRCKNLSAHNDTWEPWKNISWNSTLKPCAISQIESLDNQIATANDPLVKSNFKTARRNWSDIIKRFKTDAVAVFIKRLTLISLGGGCTGHR